MTRKVFHGVDVVVAEVKGDRFYSLLAIEGTLDDVDFQNVQRRFDVDLSLTPSRTGNLAKIKVDDRGVDKQGNALPIETALPMKSPLHITSIGSGALDAPSRGAFIGRVYLEHSRYDELHTSRFPSWPISNLDLVSLTSIWVEEPDSTGKPVRRRFHGFVATVKETTGTQVKLSIVEPGSTASKTFSFDTTDTSDTRFLCKPPVEAHEKLRSILDDLKDPSPGAIFIELTTAVTTGLRGIKVPVGHDEK
jgi:hypothetical protein